VKVLATYSIKGGVGKTTSAVNLAHAAAASGSRVLLWDLDPQGAATFFVRVRPKVKGGVERLVGKSGSLEANIHATDDPAVHIVPADFSLRHLDLALDDTKHPKRRLAALLEPVADRYDVALLDCAPGITLTSESVFAAADALIVPTIPTTLSERTLDQLTDFLADNPPAPLVLPFVSMLDRRKRLQRETVTHLLAGSSDFLPTSIPNASVIEQMGINRSPVAAFAPKSPAASAFGQLWADIAARIWP
jgi:cellulose biosynthesis protein BcsQ